MRASPRKGSHVAEKVRNKYVDYSVYLVIRIILCILQALPMQCGNAFARALALFAYCVDKRHRRVADENLRHAFGDALTEKQRRKMVYQVYEHFARVIIEIAFIPRKLHITNWKKYVTLSHPGLAIGAMWSKRPVIIATAHFGNWEMAGYFVASIGVKSFSIARDLDNPYLHRFLLKFREFTGQTILSKNGDMDRIQQVLADKHVLCSVGDQSAGPRGYFVNFFGRSASAHKAIAILAIKYDAPVIVGYAYRDQPGFHYKVGITPRVVDPRDYSEVPNAAYVMTQEITTALEEVISEKPEQYLWLHNRWKHQPPVKKPKAATAAAA